MPLTKVRPPVSDINEISRGTSRVTIPAAAGNIVVTVAGTQIAEVSPTGIDLGVLSLLAGEIDTTHVHIEESGIHAHLLTLGGTEGAVGTATPHPFGIYANSLKGLNIETDGKVTLGEQGTASGHLVNKAYVDAIEAAIVISESSLASNGHLRLSTNSGDLIVNWGTVTGNNSVLLPVTFDEVFPNAPVCAVATRVSPSTSLDRSVNVSSVTTTGMNIRNNTSTSTDVYWLAIGF